jgi:hypothetical protein
MDADVKRQGPSRCRRALLCMGARETGWWIAGASLAFCVLFTAYVVLFTDPAERRRQYELMREAQLARMRASRIPGARVGASRASGRVCEGAPCDVAVVLALLSPGSPLRFAI